MGCGQFKFSPGDECCGLPCIDATHLPPFDGFAIAEGSPAGDRWHMANGDRLQPKSGMISNRAAAWFHTIHFKSGDCDIEWDGLTIQYRSGPGTISVDGHDSIVVPAGELTAGWADVDASYGVYLTLYVTPQWYSVWVALNRRLGFEDITSRGSVQTIDRDNTAAAKTAMFTAVGDAEVVSWRFADATVTEMGEGIAECSSPVFLPSCTERYHRSRIAYEGSATITAGIDTYKLQPMPEWPGWFCEYQSSEVITYPIGEPSSGNYPNCIRQFFWRGDFQTPYISFLASASVLSNARLPAASVAEHYRRPYAIQNMGIRGNYLVDTFSANVPFRDDGTAPAQASLSFSGQVAYYYSQVANASCHGNSEDGVLFSRILDSAEAEMWIE